MHAAQTSPGNIRIAPITPQINGALDVPFFMKTSPLFLFHTKSLHREYNRNMLPLSSQFKWK
jgi:hypothetical protein